MSAAATILALSLLLVKGTPPSAPFEVHNPKQLAFSEVAAVQLFWYTSASMGRQLNAAKPVRFEPKVVLELGAAENAVITRNGVSFVQLTHWDEEIWVQGVAIAWAGQYVSNKTIEAGVKDALLNWRMTIVDVKDLRKKSD